MSNVIEFPRTSKRVHDNVPPLSLEKVKENLDVLKHSHIQETISIIAPILFQNLSLAGFELIDEDDASSIKDSAFLIEAIRSILFKFYGLEHPFQKISENVFKTEENGLLSITDTLELVLKIDEESVGAP